MDVKLLECCQEEVGAGLGSLLVELLVFLYLLSEGWWELFDFVVGPGGDFGEEFLCFVQFFGVDVVNCGVLFLLGVLLGAGGKVIWFVDGGAAGWAGDVVFLEVVGDGVLFEEVEDCVRYEFVNVTLHRLT